jgi:hypothetical protein
MARASNQTLKGRFMIKKFAISFVLLSAMSAFAQTSSTTGTRTFSFPPFGLGSTETARINVANVASESTSGTASSCTGSITFLNSTGATVGAAATFTLAAQQISSASLPFASAGLTGIHGELRAQISLTLTSGVPCGLVSSLETFDSSTGATHIYIGGAGGGFGGGGRGGPGPGGPGN